jgi:hypothetical protein
MKMLWVELASITSFRLLPCHGPVQVDRQVRDGIRGNRKEALNH